MQYEGSCLHMCVCAWVYMSVQIIGSVQQTYTYKLTPILQTHPSTRRIHIIKKKIFKFKCLIMNVQISDGSFQRF